MKTNPPRLLCRVIRRWSELADNDHSTAPRGLGSAHVENCPSCQEYFGAADEFDQALRAEARALRATSPGLEQKVIRAVRNAQPDTEPVTEKRAGSWLPAFAGVAALLVVGFFVYNSTHRAGSPQTAEVSTEDLRTVLASAGDASAKLLDRVAPAATDVLTREDPLRKELDAVYSDAQSAVSFLAANFLPDATTTRNDTRPTSG